MPPTQPSLRTLKSAYMRRFCASSAVHMALPPSQGMWFSSSFHMRALSHGGWSGMPSAAREPNSRSAPSHRIPGREGAHSPLKHSARTCELGAPCSMMRMKSATLRAGERARCWRALCTGRTDRCLSVGGRRVTARAARRADQWSEPVWQADCPAGVPSVPWKGARTALQGDAAPCGSGRGRKGKPAASSAAQTPHQHQNLVIG